VLPFPYMNDAHYTPKCCIKLHGTIDLRGLLIG
jgi:hypothetical protein